MRDHQSHDILLTCVMCHQRSNLYDSSMRAQLAEEGGAPIGTESDVKTRENFALKQVRSSILAFASHGNFHHSYFFLF